MNHQHFILYDGVCNLCVGWVQFILKRDKGSIFSFASLQSDISVEKLKNGGLPIPSLDTVVYIRNNEYFTASTAVLEILYDLGGIWKAGRIFKLIPLKIRDSIYRFVASKRYKFFGKRSQCHVARRQ